MTNGLHIKGVEGDALEAPKKVRGISHTNFFVEALKDEQVKRLFKAVELISKSPIKCIQVWCCQVQYQANKHERYDFYQR